MTATETIVWVDPTPTTMPAVDTVVLMELQGQDEPVFAGSWDGEHWRWLDGMPVQCAEVVAWARMPRGRQR